MHYDEFFEQREDICAGQPVIRGTRVPVRTILASLAGGHDPDAIHEAFPSVSVEAIRAVIAFAAASAEEDLPVPRALIPA